MAVLTDERTGSHPGETAISQEFDAVPRAVRQVRDAVAAFAARHGAAGEGVDDIRTAVSEAATNVVMHAYDGDCAGRFRVLAVVGGDQMLVIIDDDGCGLGTPTTNPGLGLGLQVMAQTAEQALFLIREQGGSTVQLRFRLS
jgi:anti-sigma regulatory factor (Ser/Thr protein kinase)